MKTIIQIAQQLLNAMAFDNAGNRSEFEAMLLTSTRVESAPSVSSKASTASISRHEAHDAFVPSSVSA